MNPAALTLVTHPLKQLPLTVWQGKIKRAEITGEYDKSSSNSFYATIAQKTPAVRLVPQNKDPDE